MNDYKFNEPKLLEEIREYIDSTYKGHYGKKNFQAAEFIIDCDYGEGYMLGNIMKYAQRYGKKKGRNRDDLMKIVHYAILMLYVHDLSAAEYDDLVNTVFASSNEFRKTADSIDINTSDDQYDYHRDIALVNYSNFEGKN